jgi:hypothetical protein
MNVAEKYYREGVKDAKKKKRRIIKPRMGTDEHG